MRPVQPTTPGIAGGPNIGVHHGSGMPTKYGTKKGTFTDKTKSSLQGNVGTVPRKLG